MKYKVVCKNQKYNGITATIQFKNGVGYVENKENGAINYFYGEDAYSIIDYNFLEDLTYNELKSYANSLGIKMIGVTKEQLKEEILKKEGMM